MKSAVSFWWKPLQGCAWDPANQTYPTPDTRKYLLTNSNLTAQSNFTTGLASPTVICCTASHATGKWYCEMGLDAGEYDVYSRPALGIVNTVNDVGLFSAGTYVNTLNGFLWVAGGQITTSPGTHWTPGDRAGIAIDIEAGKIWLAKNNVWYLTGDPAAGTNWVWNAFTGTAFAAFSAAGGSGEQKVTIYPTAASFSYTPPTGFSAWCS